MVPLLVTAFTEAPVKPDCVTSYGAIDTETCSIASKEIGVAPVCPPGVGESKPNGLLKIDPSSEKLLNWSFLPPNEPPLAEGSKRVKSLVDLEIVGSVVSSFLPKLFSAPVRSFTNVLSSET